MTKEKKPEETPSKAKEKESSKIVKIVLIAVGTVALALGAIGVFLPILPTTPFLLLAAACYCRSSKRLYCWLLNNKWFGEYIRNYKEGKGIPLKTKLFALAVLWTTIGVSTVFMLNHLLPESLVLPMQVAMVAVAVAVSVHILRLPTFKKAPCSTQ
ncbi:MAG: YbaN family protein [Candidatus Bathyarchaeota archaeon]|nr:YbaN family protein [Candidatus Bathyarchaeota archaeon]